MKKITYILRRDAALAAAQNFRYFGWWFKAVLVGNNRVKMTTRAWTWSHFILLPTDFA